jgi:aspartyl-tRNA(Asn)/glutamyl-tRNA(Gln) amidotransferase subunit A
MTVRPAWQMNAGALAAAYREGRLDPESVVEQLADRIRRVNPAINALVHMHPRLREQARASAQRLRDDIPLSALDGIPIAVKDNILTSDMPTCWGTAGLRDRPGTVDESCVERLRRAGAILLGKTNVPEFTLEGYTSNGVYGTTRNPWNTSLTPGGSSGGAVAGLAAGLFPLAIGTDGGGSIRRPASHTGVVGLKPTIGAVARVHTLPPLLLDFEVVGPMARTVGDLRMLFDVMRGPDPLDPDSIDLPAPVANARMRILYVPRIGDAPVDPAIEASVAQGAQVFADLGHAVTEGVFPFDLEAINRFWPLIGQAGLAAMFDADSCIRERAAEKYRRMAEEGMQVDAKTFLAGWHSVAALRRECARFFTQIDVILMPAAAALPWSAGQPYPDRIAGREVGPRGHAVFTGWVNAAGHPAVALPCRPSADGLPIGMQLVGPRRADLQLLELASQYEQRVPWIGQTAPL